VYDKPKEQIVRLMNVVCTAENLVSTGTAPEIYIANTTDYYYYYYYRYECLLSQAFLPGTSLEPAVISTAQASSFTLQYFPYYV
jgi:hypothetical protein